MSTYKIYSIGVLLLLIINSLAIIRVPIKEYREYSNKTKSLEMQLFDRYAPLQNRLKSEKYIGYFTNFKETILRHQIVQYIMAPGTIVLLSAPNFPNYNWKDHPNKMQVKYPQYVIFDGPNPLSQMKEYSIYLKLNETLFVLKNK